MLAEFVAEYHREWKRLRNETTSERSTTETELKIVSQQIDKIVEAITEGMFHASMKSKMDALKARKATLASQLLSMPPQEPILLHPVLAEAYGVKIRALAASLNDEAYRVEASELLRGLVSEVRLHPDETAPDGHLIELYGELAAILELAGPKNDKTHRFKCGSSVSLVAGVGFEPTTFRL